MRVSSVQSNNSSQIFNGKVSVTNLMTKQTRVYKTESKVDKNLIAISKKINSAANVDSGIAFIKKYVAEIYNSAKDEFLNNLPAIVKKEAGEISLTSDYTYAIYKGGDVYSELKTKGFAITHDVVK